MLTMFKYFLTIFVRLSVCFLILAGSMQAHGLVFCTGCKDGSSVEFSALDGSCSSCPDKDSRSSKTNHSVSELKSCNCLDQPLNSGELVTQQSKDPLLQVHLAIHVVNIFIQPVSFKEYLLKPHFSSSDLPPSSFVLKRTVILLI